MYPVEPGQTAPRTRCRGVDTTGHQGAPRGDAIRDPELREAHDATERILDGLLAGKFDRDNDLRPVAAQVQGFRSWSITAQTLTRPGEAEFTGHLSGPNGRASFSLGAIKQQDGHWAVGTFSGPKPD